MVVTSSSIIPVQVRGRIDAVLDSDADWRYWYPWLENLRGTNTFVHLGAMWRSKSWPQDPDPGYDYYVIGGDSGMWGWDDHVANLHHCPVYLISLPEVYHPASHPLVQHIPNICYHQQIAKLSCSTQLTSAKNIRYKVSALTSRLTQSKVIIFAAIKKFLASQDIFVTLHNRLEQANVHYWQPTHDALLDELTSYFRDNFLGCEVRQQGDCGNPLSIDNPAYTESAINFTQESYHYSLMHDEARNLTSTLPGPFLTEKTFKCLLSQTAFVPVGQFRSYRWLETMGMQFEYGLDLNFDDDAGNITRLHSVVDLIQQLSLYTAQDLFEMTQASTRHNYSLITSGEFWDRCEKRNQSALTLLYDQVLG